VRQDGFRCDSETHGLMDCKHAARLSAKGHCTEINTKMHTNIEKTTIVDPL